MQQRFKILRDLSGDFSLEVKDDENRFAALRERRRHSVHEAVVDLIKERRPWKRVYDDARTPQAVRERRPEPHPRTVTRLDMHPGDGAWRLRAAGPGGDRHGLARSRWGAYEGQRTSRSPLELIPEPRPFDEDVGLGRDLKVLQHEVALADGIRPFPLVRLEVHDKCPLISRDGLAAAANG